MIDNIVLPHFKTIFYSSVFTSIFFNFEMFHEYFVKIQWHTNVFLVMISVYCGYNKWPSLNPLAWICHETFYHLLQNTGGPRIARVLRSQWIVLIGDWFRTKVVKLANSIFKVLFFYINNIFFSNKKPVFSVQNSILNALETKYPFFDH